MIDAIVADFVPAPVAGSPPGRTDWTREEVAALFDRPLLDLLTAPHVETGGRPRETYGYGVLRIEHDGSTIFNHSGALEDFSAFVGWSVDRQLGVAALTNASPQRGAAGAVGLNALSTFLDLSPDWRPPKGPKHPLAAYTGVYVDEAGTLGRLQVSLTPEGLAIDYLDGRPPLLPPRFRFVFERGAERARYVVTAVGVGQRQGH